MNIKELNAKYTNGELSSPTGDAELRRKEFSPLLLNLYENKAVYHERFTCILKLENIKLNADGFTAIAIPHLLIEENKLVNKFYPRKPWKVGASWRHLQLSENVLIIITLWQMWCDSDLVKQVEELTIEKKFKEASALTLNSWRY
jgi:hypothetical protein